MSDWTAWRFASPLFFVLVVMLAPIVYAALLGSSQSRVRFSAVSLVRSTSGGRHHLFRLLPLVLRVLALFFLIISLARPQGGNVSREVTSEGTDIMLVADTSGSMEAMDFTLGGEHVSFVKGVNLPCHLRERNGILLIPDLAARVTLMDRSNRVLAHLGEGPENFRDVRKQPRSSFPTGKFIAPHDACFDHAGNIFVAEWVPIGRVSKLRRLS